MEGGGRKEGGGKEGEGGRERNEFLFSHDSTFLQLPTSYTNPLKTMPG